jgi:hypothetical protein
VVIGIGCDTEGTPTHGTGDDEFGRGVYGGHKDLTPTLKRRLSPLVGVSGVTGGDARDGQRKAQRHMGGIAICSEADFASSEYFKGTQGSVVACFPSFPDSQRRLSFINVARPFNAEAPVNLVSAMAAIATNEAV